MLTPASRDSLSTEISARAVVSVPQAGTCPAPGCGKLLSGRQQACSNCCRAALSRRRRKDAQRTRDEEIRALLETALKKLEEGAP